MYTAKRANRSSIRAREETEAYRRQMTDDRLQTADNESGYAKITIKGDSAVQHQMTATGLPAAVVRASRARRSSQGLARYSGRQSKITRCRESALTVSS